MASLLNDCVSAATLACVWPVQRDIDHCLLAGNREAVSPNQALERRGSLCNTCNRKNGRWLSTQKENKRREQKKKENLFVHLRFSSASLCLPVTSRWNFKINEDASLGPHLFSFFLISFIHLFFPHLACPCKKTNWEYCCLIIVQMYQCPNIIFFDKKVNIHRALSIEFLFTHLCIIEKSIFCDGIK